MPYYRKRKKVYKKKKTFRKRVYKKKSVPRGLRQAILPFQREKTFFIDTSAPVGDLPTGWTFGTFGSTYNTLQCSQQFHLQDLPGVNEFNTLFKTYKINCILVSITSIHNTSQFTTGSVANYYGANMIVHYAKNITGHPLDTAITEDYWNQLQAKRTKLMTGNSTIRFKIYPTISSITYIDAVTTTGSVRKPSWLATSVAGYSIPHFGLDMQFSYVNPAVSFQTAAGGTGSPLMFRCTYKYLFQMRGVQ